MPDRSGVIVLTKVEAIRQLMMDNGGAITLRMLYDNIEKYYPEAKRSSEWQAGLRGVLYRDIGKSFKKLDGSVYALKNFNEFAIDHSYENELVAEKEMITKVMTLQNKYRKELLKLLSFCPITGVKDKRLLIASHIKPWCLSTSEEKIDVNNGLILSPVYDKLFDNGLITFTKEKELIVSSSLSKETVKALNIRSGIYERLPVFGREKYLQYHNDNIFIS